MSDKTRLAWLALPGLALVVWLGCGRAEVGDPQPDRELAKQIRGGEAGGGAADSASTAEPAGEGWGKLVGVFHYQGSAPQLGSLATGGKDAEVCDQAPIPDQSLIVDSGSGGIKNIIVYARRTSRIHESYEASAEEPQVFDQENCLFLSHVMPMRVSQPLMIKNSDPIGHNTNISPPADRSVNVLLPGGGESEYQFTRQQNTPVAVACNIHPWMKSYILPRNDPYFALTDEQGQFTIENLPAGEEIEFQIWHERSSGSQGALQITGLTDGNGRFKQTIPADGELNLETIEVPPGAFQ